MYKDQPELSVNISCGQILSFVLRMKKGDIVLTPANGNIMIGEVISDYYREESPPDKCEYKNRRKVRWLTEIERSTLPERLRASLFAWQTVFNLDKHGDNIDRIIKEKPIPVKVIVGSDVINVMQERLLELEPDFFQEKLIPSLLEAMGFEAEANPTYTADGGIDVIGTFRMGIFTGEVRVQVKRSKQPIGVSVVRELRGSLKVGHQGILITTSSFTEPAKKEAEDVSKAGGRIFLIDGRKLAELILEVYDKLYEEIKEELERRFGLKKTFVIFSK